MAAGDLALNIALTATNLASPALANVSASAVTTAGYLATLGDQAFTTGVGFNGLATSTAGLDASLGSLDASFTGVDASAKGASASLNSVAVSEDTASASADTGIAKFAMVGMALAAVAVVAGVVGYKAVKMAGDFQQSVTKLYTTAGEAKNNLQMVSDGILAMSSQVGTGAQKLVEAMYWIESGGLHGAAGLSALRIAAEAAKAENANLDQVSIALAASLNAYAGAGMTDVQVMNTLTAATGQGMMTFEQLSGSLASVLPAAAKFHVSLNNITAALATMTAQGDPAAQAATHLKQVILALEAPSKIGAKSLASVGLTSARVAKEMQTSLPDALKMITDAVGKKFPEGSSAYNQAIKNIAGGSKQMMGFLELTGTHIGTFAANVGKIGSAVTAGGKDLMGWSDIQKNFNFQVDAAKAAFDALLITLGLKLLPVLTQIVSHVAPTISAFTNWITSGNNLVDMLHTLSPVLIAIGIMLAAVIIPAVWGLAAGVIAATWPVLAIGAALTGLVMIFQHFYATNAGFTSFINGLIDKFKQLSGIFTVVKSVFGTVSGIIHQVADAFMAVFFPVQKVQQSLIPITPYIDRVGTGFNTLKNATSPLASYIDRVGVGFNVVKNAVSPLANYIERLGDRFHAANQAFNPFVSFFQNIQHIIQASIPVFQSIWRTIQDIGGALATSFLPVWQQLVSVFQSNLMPSLKELWAALVPLAPVLKELGKIVGIILVVVLGLLVGVLVGVVKGFAYFLTGVFQVVGGIITLVTGLVQFLSGVITFIYDLFTGNFSKLGSDLGRIWSGIVNMFKGVWEIITGIFRAAWGAISGLVGGFVQGVIGFFKHLADTLVGHSIVPEMLNLMVAFFANFASHVASMIVVFVINLINHFLDLRSQAISAVRSMISMISGLIGGLIGNAFSWGANLIGGFIHGIGSMIGNVASAAQNVVSTVKNFLGFGSPAKMGEGRYIIQWGENMVSGFVQGMHNKMPLLNGQISHMIQAPNVAYGGSSLSGSVNNSQMNITVQLDSRKVMQALGVRQAKEVRIQGGYHSN